MQGYKISNTSKITKLESIMSKKSHVITKRMVAKIKLIKDNYWRVMPSS